MFQSVTVAGYVGNDPEVRVMPSGAKVANFSVATTEKWKDKSSGEQREHTEWFRCTAFGQQAEFIEKYVSKGKPFLVVGRQRTDKVDKDGDTQYFVKLIVSEIRFLPDGKRGESPGNYVPQGTREEQRATSQRQAPSSQADDGFDDEIPF